MIILAELVALGRDDGESLLSLLLLVLFERGPSTVREDLLESLLILLNQLGQVVLLFLDLIFLSLIELCRALGLSLGVRSGSSLVGFK